jgi:hypothetical protein
MALTDEQKRFLRADRDRRERKSSGEDEINAIQQQPEVVELLKRADALQRHLQNYVAPPARTFDDELENYIPLNRAAGPNLCAEILEYRKQLRQALKADNHGHIHRYIESLSKERARNYTIAPVVVELKRMVDGFSESIDDIPRQVANLNAALSKYVQKLRNLNPGQSIGAGEAQEGQRPEDTGGEIEVISNFHR